MTAIITIQQHYDQLDIKGCHTILAEPIKVAGTINLAKLAAQPDAWQVGIDEAGRGPLLGSVTVAAAILPADWSGLIEDAPLKNTPLSALTDSKKLSEKKRDLLYPQIQAEAVGFVIADIPAAVIDQLNILQATMTGMALVVETLMTTLLSQNTEVLNIQALFDGNRCPDLNENLLNHPRLTIDSQAWVKGDARHTSMAAASVLAKVYRDQTMIELAKRHPNYLIESHKGYPTKAHLQAIEQFGVLPEHRRSYRPVRLALERDLVN